MPRRYKRSKSSRMRKSRSRGGASCNNVPKLPYADPCSVGGVLDAEFSLKGGSRLTPYRRRYSNKRRSLNKKSKRRVSNRKRKSRKMRGSGFGFNPASIEGLNVGGLHAMQAYNDCCPPNYAPGVANPVSFGAGQPECGKSGQSGGAKFDCQQPNWNKNCM